MLAGYKTSTIYFRNTENIWRITVSQDCLGFRYLFNLSFLLNLLQQKEHWREEVLLPHWEHFTKSLECISQYDRDSPSFLCLQRSPNLYSYHNGFPSNDGQSCSLKENFHCNSHIWIWDSVSLQNGLMEPSCRFCETSGCWQYICL